MYCDGQPCPLDEESDKDQHFPAIDESHFLPVKVGLWNTAPVVDAFFLGTETTDAVNDNVEVKEINKDHAVYDSISVVDNSVIDNKSDNIGENIAGYQRYRPFSYFVLINFLI